MKALAEGNGRQQKVGGLAALYLAAAYLVAMPYFLLLVKYPSVVDPAKKVALLVRDHDSMRVMYLITYVVFGIVLAVLALALSARLKDGAPTLTLVATVAGLIWAFVLVASGMIFNAGAAAVVGLHAAHPAQAGGGVAGDRAGGSGPRWIRRRAPRRSVGPAGERGRAAHRRTAQGAELARSDDRRCGCPLGRAGARLPRIRLRVAADRVVRVVGHRHAAHACPLGRSCQHHRDHVGRFCAGTETLFSAALTDHGLTDRPLLACNGSPASGLRDR